MNVKDIAAKVAAATWRAVKPIALKPHTWVVIGTAVAGYLGKQVAPETFNDVAGIIVNILSGL